MEEWKFFITSGVYSCSDSRFEIVDLMVSTLDNLKPATNKLKYII
jgi:hypothetical protein